MKIKKITLIFFIFILSLKSLSYEAFDGRYKYNDLNDENNFYENISNKNEEVLFIVDFSGSMNAVIGDKTRIKHALNAIKHILETSNKSAKIGLRIFGASAFEKIGRQYIYNEEKLCEASSLILPVAQYNSANIIDKLENTNPIGMTPIYFSLKQAVQYDFSNEDETRKHIILVTDGYENCNGNPCQYIRDLMKLRSDYKIDVIGITVDNNTYSQLSCIAKEGRGSFYPVNTPEDFTIKFKQAFSSTPSYSPDLLPVSFQRNITPQEPDIVYKNFVFQFDY